MIDPKTNKFRDFDINAGAGKSIGHVQGDEGMLKKMNYVPNEWELSQGRNSIFQGFGRIIPPRVIS